MKTFLSKHFTRWMMYLINFSSDVNYSRTSGSYTTRRRFFAKLPGHARRIRRVSHLRRYSLCPPFLDRFARFRKNIACEWIPVFGDPVSPQVLVVTMICFPTRKSTWPRIFRSGWPRRWGSRRDCRGLVPLGNRLREAATLLSRDDPLKFLA